MTTIASSPRIPPSPDARRRQRQPKEKRKQLRDFYGLQSAESGESVDHDPILDDTNYNLDAHLRTLDGKSISELLKIENNLIKQIRLLDGDRKALVYDNYGRMITASDTMKRIHTQLDPMRPQQEQFNDMMNKLDTLSAIEPSDEEVTISADEMLRNWVREGPARVETMMERDKEGAFAEIKDIEKDLDCLEEEEKEEMTCKLSDLLSRLRQ